MLTAMQLMEIEKLEAEAIAPLQAELSELADQASELHARMGEAMQKNNMKAYQQYDTEHRAISARMDYLQNKIQHPDPLYTKESVLSAWADYAADYNADIWPLIAEYHKARKALAEQYGLELGETELAVRAEAFAIRAGGRSARVAKQFAELCKAGVLHS